MQAILKFVNKHPQLLFIVSWAIINIYSINNKGIVTNFEAARYIGESNLILNGNGFSDIAYFFYSVPIFLISFSRYIGCEYYIFIAIQYLCSLISILFLYATLVKISNRQIALFCTIFYTLCLQINEYNSFVFSDSLFISFSTLAICFGINYFLNPQKKCLIGIIFISILLLLTRPLGLPIVFAFLSTLAIYYFKNKLKIYIAVMVVILFATSLCAYFIIIKTNMFNFLLPFIEGRIICGIPTATPNNLFIPQNNNPVFAYLSFAFYNPYYFFKSCFLKTIAFFGMYRRHYTFTHNIINYGYFWPIFITGFWGIKMYLKHNKILFYLLFLPVLFTYLVVILSCDDWGNRFILPIIVYFIIGVAHYLNRKFYNNK